MAIRSATFAASVVALAAVTAAQGALADPPASERAALPMAKDFTLVDHAGATHNLYALIDAPAIVIATHMNGDAMSGEAVKSLDNLKGIFRKAEYYLLNSSPTDTRETIAAEAKAAGITIPILDDADQSVARSLGATQTGEAYIIDPIGWKVVYHGPIGDVAAQPTEAPYLLFNALVDTLSHRPLQAHEAGVKGTPIR
jgi:peroxiredoxin